MSQIVHYISTDSNAHMVAGKQVTEYVVITDDPDTANDYILPYFQIAGRYDLDRTGILPTERILIS